MAWQNFPDHVDPALVAKAVIHACGERPDEIIKRQQNRRRATYEVRCPERVLFFKIEISISYGFPSLALEKWALEKAAEIGLPVPEPLARDCSESKFPFRWLLLSALPGVSLTDAGLAPDVEAMVVRQTGALLCRLHQVRVEGFGTLQDDEYLRMGRVRGGADDWRRLIVIDACESNLVDFAGTADGKARRQPRVRSRNRAISFPKRWGACRSDALARLRISQAAPRRSCPHAAPARHSGKRCGPPTSSLPGSASAPTGCNHRGDCYRYRQHGRTKGDRTMTD